MGKSPRVPSNASSVAYNDDATSAQKRGRDVLGCLTCRVRRKKCPDSKGDDTMRCSACVRNALDCLGYPGPSPPWAGRTQRRLRECALRSKLWIELSKGVNRPAAAILDLSFYRAHDLPLDLTAQETHILNALEWQCYLHAHDKERPPDCPRPDFCEFALSLDQLIQYHLLQVQNYEPFGTLQYIPGYEEPVFKGKGVTMPHSSSREGSNDIQQLGSMSESEPSSSATSRGYYQPEDAVLQRPRSPNPVADTRSHTPVDYHGTRSLPPPTRRSLTDSVHAPVIRRRDALTVDTLNPTEHISPSDLLFWQHRYQDGQHPSGPYSAIINNEPQYADSSIASTPERPSSARAEPRHEFRLPPIRQQEIAIEGLPAFSHIYQPQPMHATRARTIYHEALMRSATPRIRQSDQSPDISASPSPSPSSSTQSRVSGIPRFQADSRLYTGTPAMTASERTWGLDPSSIQQHSPSLAYGSMPPFPSNYVREGIAPHEHAPSSSASAYRGLSGRSIAQPFPTPRSSTTQGSDERSPSPRQLRLLSFQPYLSGELSE